MTASRPLTGVHVLDASGPIGAYATRLLADLGADVLVLEPPDGDPLRRTPPFADGRSGPDASLVFAHYHAGKRAAVLDVGADADRDTLERVGHQADVVVISPSSRAPLAGFDPVTRRLEWARDDTVVCAITPYGLTGPWRDRRATPFLSYAASGDMHRYGPPEGPPTALPGRVAWDEVGIHAAICVLAALFDRRARGGQLVDLSVHDVLCAKDFFVERYSTGGQDPAPREIRIGYPPTGRWRCADGEIDIGAHQASHWDAFLETLGHPDVLAAPSLRDALVRREIFDGLVEVIDDLLASEHRDDVVGRAQAAGLPCSPFNTPAQFVDDLRRSGRAAIVTVHHPSLGDLELPAPAPVTSGSLLQGGASPPSFDRSTPAAFATGEDDRGRALGRPLRDVRVLSFGAFIAGNTAAQTLAELGADVVKIEARARPEVLRTPAYSHGRVGEEPSGVTVTVLSGSLSRGVRNLSLDVHTPEGRALFLRLVEHADVVIENFASTSTLSDLALGHTELRARNPRLVMLSLSGYGRTGTRRTWRAYATNISCFVGLSHAWGSTHGTLTDYLCSAHGVLGVLAGLAHASATGEGLLVDAAQVESAAAVLAPLFLDPLVNRRDPGYGPNIVPGALHTCVVQCAGDDRWLAIELEDTDDWSRLCTVLDTPHLLAHDTWGRDDARAELDAELAAWAASRSPHTAALLLQHAGVAAAVVHDMEDVAHDPSLRSRGAVVEIDHPDLGVIEHVRSGYRMASGSGASCRPAARLGEDTAAVLHEWLAVTDDELDSLAQRGAVFCVEPARATPRRS